MFPIFCLKAAGTATLDYTFQEKDGTEFFVGVESTNAKKGGAGWYNVDVLSFSGNAVASLDSAAVLAMPETDSLASTDSLSFGQYGTDALADASASAFADLDDKSGWMNVTSLA